MSHEIKKNEQILTRGEKFSALSQIENSNFVLSPGLISEFEKKTPAKSAGQMQDSLLLRSWLSGKSVHTKRAYLRISEKFLNFLHPRALTDATIQDLQLFVDNREGLRKNSIAQKVAAIKSIFTFAYKSGYLPANLGVFIKGVKGVKRLTERYLTEEEVALMLEKTKDPRDLAVLSLLYISGVRVSELVALNWKDVQERKDGEAQIKIFGKGEKERVVVISKSTFELLKAIRPESFKTYEPVFPSFYGKSKRLSDRTIRDIVFKAALRAGIMKQVSPHWLRHSHASHALDHGAPLSLIKETFGHASIATTSEYVHARPGESSGKYLGAFSKKSDY